VLLCRPMNRIPPVLAPALYVPGLLFELVVRARNGLYGASLLPRHRLDAPVISIGNITMGGTGKTPFVIHVAQTLSTLGFVPAILTRGYGRRGSGESHILAPGDKADASTVGDEPALIRRHLSSAWMGVSKNRSLTGNILSKRGTGIVFVLDDGFQHRKVRRDLDIVMVDSTQPLASNRVFPRGTLREPVSGLNRCDIVVINDSGEPGKSDAIKTEIERLNIRSKIFRCTQRIRALVHFPSWKSMESPAGELRLPAGAYLISALGNPERFRHDVRRLGIEITGAKWFPDHHQLRDRDWQDCIQEARRTGAEVLITTEKDAVKTGRTLDFPLLVAIQSTTVAEAGAFELALKKCLEERL
jgi:tetraacyldisaccharide 4'-kinase